MTSKNFKIKNGLDIGDVADVITVSNGVATITGTVSSEGSSLGNIRIGVTTDNEIDTSTGNLTIDSAGGTTTVDDNLTVNGTLNDGTTNLAATFAELNIMDGDTAATSTTVADADRVVFNDAGTMKQVAVTDLAAYFDDEITAMPNLVTTGALDSGSITSGFGAIDNGSSNITTSGTIQYGSLSDGTITITAFVDEDNMASNSATLVPTQQSVKAYVDSEIGALSSVAITEGNTNVTVADSGTGTVTVTVDGATHSVFAAAGITLSQGEFVGTATAAEYADLAERFHADAEYPRGTVMMMGGDHEVTICNVEACENIIGVVSDDAQAGFKMNTSSGTDATHPYIALAGRVDVKVIGAVAKGDRLVSSGTPGVARAAQPGEATAFNVIGRALEDNDSNEVAVIKAFVVANR